MARSRAKAFLGNSLSTAVLQIITMLAGLITPRIMLAYYGSEVNGLVTSITQLVTYVNLVEAGLSNAATYALYKPLAEKNHKAISSVVSAARHFYMQAGLLAFGIIAVLAVGYPLYISTDLLTPVEVGILVVLVGSRAALIFITLAKYRVLLTADQKTYVVSFASIVFTILNTLIIVVMGVCGASILWLKLVALSAVIVRSLILWYYCKKHYTYVDYNAEPDKAALSNRWDALYLQVFGAIHRSGPVMLVTFVLKDMKLVSVFAIYNMVMSSLNSILSIFKSGLPASFGELIASGETETLRKSYGEFEFLYYKLITIVYSVAFVMIMPFVKLYTAGVTDANYYVPAIGVLIVLDGLLYNLKTPQGMLIISAGQYKETRVQVTIQGAIAILGGALLALKFGIIGILIASILSNLYRDIDLLFYIPKNITGLPIKDTLRRWAILGGSFLAVIGIYSLIPFGSFETRNFINWALCACVAGVISLAVAGGTGYFLEREELFSVIKRLKRMFKKKAKKAA